MTSAEFETQKRSLQVRIGRGRAKTRRALTAADKIEAMKTVQQLESALSRLYQEHYCADGA